MNLNLRRTLAVSVASLVVLAGAACSKETAGKASISSSNASESAETSETEESSESSESKSDGPAGSQTSSDGTFTFEFPAGYADASGQLSVPSAVASAYDESGTTFPTTIVVTKEALKGYSLEEMAEAVTTQLEKNFSTTAEKADDFPLESIDGEEAIAYTTGDYEQGGQTIVSAIVLTQHEDDAYAFIVNTLTGEESAAGNALIDFIESVQWS